MASVVLVGEVINAPTAGECDRLLASGAPIRLLIKLDVTACLGIPDGYKKNVEVEVGQVVSRMEFFKDGSAFRQWQFAGCGMAKGQVYDIAAELVLPLGTSSRKQRQHPCSGTLIMRRSQAGSEHANRI